MEGSQNFERLGKTIYNHNPNTGKTYKGKPSDVKAGDIIIFNNKLDGTRQDNGDFKYPNEAPGKGHVSVVLEVRDDGSIVALGGNQSAGATSYITGGKSKGGIRASLYTPEIMKQYYKGGFKINRLTDTSLTQADPEIVAAIIKDAGLGGDGQ
jgi:surface antigen